MDRNDAAIPLPPQVTPVAEEDPVEEAEPDMEALEPELEDVPLPPVPEIIRPEKSAVPIDPIPRIAVHFFGNGRFGVTTNTGNPDDPEDDNKRLTYSYHGETNNTLLKIDQREFFLDILPASSSNQEISPGRYECRWVYFDIQLTRTIEIVPGDVSRRLDGIEVKYAFENKGKQDHLVGLREMLDTLIGNNDGVPFIVPGEQGIVTNPQTYRGDAVPDFIRALERGDLARPGVVVDIGLRVDQAERPSELVLAHWPGAFATWNFDRTTKIGKDSAAGIYFEPRNLRPGEVRTIGYSYGLGAISSTRTKNAKISLTAGGPFTAGGKFWLTALVQNPKSNQSLTVSLPEGLSVGSGESVTKPVPVGTESFTQLSWLVQTTRSCIGDREVAVKLQPDETEERQVLTFRPPEAKLSLISRGEPVGGEKFWISALIRNPVPGQMAQLTLPAGVTLDAKHPAMKSVATDADVAQVNWLVRADVRTSGSREFKVRLTPEPVEEMCVVEIGAGKLISLAPRGKAVGGGRFWISAVVRSPQSGQTVTLTLPSGVSLDPKHPKEKSVPGSDGVAQIHWLVRVDPRTSGPIPFTARLSPDGVSATSTVNVEPGQLNLIE